MQIYTFGCSFTHGDNGKDGLYSHNRGNVNWVRSLAKKFPQHNFFNNAVCGTSIEFSVAQLSVAPKDAFKIFQITVPWRKNFWKQEDLQNYLIKNDNYTGYNRKVTDCVEQYHPNLNTNVIDTKRFHKQYYTKQNDFLEKTQYLAYHEYIKKNSNFVFYHYYHPDITDETIPCIQNILGPELFAKYDIDGNFHFNQEGCDWIAEWIAKNLDL